MTFGEVCERFPALLELHGGTRSAFHRVLYRAARGRRPGSGIDLDYQLWHLRVVALGVLVHRLLPSAHIPDDALREAIWDRSKACIRLYEHPGAPGASGVLWLDIPTGIWNELLNWGDE